MSTLLLCVESALWIAVVLFLFWKLAGMVF